MLRGLGRGAVGAPAIILTRDVPGRHSRSSREVCDVGRDTIKHVGRYQQRGGKALGRVGPDLRLAVVGTRLGP